MAVTFRIPKLPKSGDREGTTRAAPASGEYAQESRTPTMGPEQMRAQLTAHDGRLRSPRLRLMSCRALNATSGEGDKPQRSQSKATLGWWHQPIYLLMVTVAQSGNVSKKNSFLEARKWFSLGSNTKQDGKFLSHSYLKLYVLFSVSYNT